jgi:hypothetical protein
MWAGTVVLLPAWRSLAASFHIYRDLTNRPPPGANTAEKREDEIWQPVEGILI